MKKKWQESMRNYMATYEINKCPVCSKFLGKDGKCSFCEDKEREKEQTVAIETAGCTFDIHIRDDKEADYVRKIAKDYDDIDFEVPDTGAQLESLLTLRLESKRIQKALAEIGKKDVESRKALTEQLNKNQVSIQKTQDTLGITRDKLQERASSPVQIFADTAEQVAQFRIENKHIFRGVAKCEKCEAVIIFEGYLPTFENWFKEEYKLIKDKLKEENRYSGEMVEEEINQLFKTYKSMEIYKEKYRKYVMKKFD
jgi:hypothetical protein